ncbi:DNA adenine methylase [Brevibacillus sp. NPDC058079]|uniref:DNA adenine methylase n=1 Tax=Brevibacillus sp. NPDC058079 TaxID=3346330 RepID=UPI0036E24836
MHYPDSKWSLADWIIEHMPEHRAYLEPFFGSGVVLFNKRSATLETLNDIDGDVVNLFQMIRERTDDLARMLYWTPYSREEYKAVYDLPNDDVDELPNKISLVAERL